MFCRYCGKSIEGDSEFCSYCGKSLATSADGGKGGVCKQIHSINQKAGCFFTQHISLIVKTLCYIALGVFLFFNIKMAPFFGFQKFIAYIAEGAIAIFLVVLTNKKIAENPSFALKILSIICSLLLIISSIGLRIIYDSKVDIALRDIPNSGTILVDIHHDTDYYSYSGGLVYGPHTSVELNGVNDITEITIGEPIQLEIECRSNYKTGTASDTITLYASDFKNGDFSITKKIYYEDGLQATIKVTLERTCTFWDVVFY